MAAYGLPVDELTRAIDWAFWPLTMPDYDLNCRVKKAMHALALDDERNTFHPKLWNEAPWDVIRPGGQAKPAPGTDWSDPSRISQVWFAGVHSNVGGGYPDDTLSYVSLLWILRGASKAGLRLLPSLLDEYARLADENGPIYDSRKGLAGYYRYNPRRISNVLCKNGVTVQSIRVHESVLRRIKLAEDGYAPIVLPPRFDVVRIDGELVDGAAYLGIPGQDVLARETEHVWNWVWRRRAAYFGTLGASLALASMPLWADVSPNGACDSALCFLAGPIRWLGAVLPSFAEPWIQVFAANPGLSSALSLAVVTGLLLGQRLMISAGDRMRAAWYSLEATRPSKLSRPPAQPRSRLDEAIERLRTSGWYQDGMAFTTRYLLPGAFVVGVVYGGLALLSQLSLAVAESVGGVCFDGEPSRADTVIRTHNPCNATNVRVETGRVYRLVLRITESWADGPMPFGGERLPATPNGLLLNSEPTYMAAGVPLRRHIAQPWFKLMGRVGAKGTDTYAPQWRRMDSTAAADEGAKPGQVWESIVTARSTGRLYLYVNDATLYPLLAPFYPSNKGAASLIVEAAPGAQ